MKKRLLRVVSMVLTLTMVLQMGILEIGAYALGNDTSMSIEEDVQATSSIEIVGEDISKREESIKHFRMSDGTYLAVSYAEPVHYRSDDGDWQEIDNTLKEGVQQISVPMAAMDVDATASASNEQNVDLSENAFVNTSNNFGVSLPEKLNDQSWIGTFHMGHSLYFRFENIDEAEANPSDPDVQGMNAFERATTVRTTSSVAYENVLPGVDVLYHLDGQQLKENILFGSLNDTPDSLSFIIWAEDLELSEAEDGSHVFKAGNKICFSLPAPFMVDDEGESSGTVQVTVEEISEDTYRFTYVPDRQWLQSEDRVWPVVLDPVTCATSSAGTIEDTYTRSGYPTYNYYRYSYVYTGYYSASTKNVRGFVQHNATPTLSSGDVVVKSELYMTGRIYKGSGAIQVNAYAVTEEWDASTTKWNTQPDAEAEVLDFQLVDSSSYETYTWDVTSAVQRWYSGDLAGKGALGKYGFMLASPADEDSGVVHATQFYSSDTSSGIKPQLLIYYRNTTGLESYWDYTSASAGRAGTIAVNNYTGNLVVSRTDMAYDGNIMPASMTFTYNTNDCGTNIGYGNGWRANYAQTIVAQTISGISYYCWTDGDGTRIYFYNDNGTWKDENGLKYTLTVGSSSFTITDIDGNSLVFDANGRLATVIDGKINTNKIQIGYVAGVTTPKISTVTDGAGRQYSYAYGSDGNLSAITYQGVGSTSLEEVSYTYSGNQLTKITYADGNTATYTYSGNYLVNATGCQNDNVVISYSNGGTSKVKQVTTKDSSTTVSSASFIYGDNYTKVTDNNGRWSIYQFNNLGNTVSVYNHQGQALFGTYSENTPNQLVNSSRLQDTVTNLLSTRAYTSDWSQDIAVTPGKMYTLSGMGTGHLALEAGDLFESGFSVENNHTEVTIQIPAGVTTATMIGYGEFTDLQFEQTESASRYNMLYDTDMTSVGNWNGTNTGSGDGRSTADTASRAHLDTSALLINGNGTTAKQFKQTINVTGVNGDNYSFGAWVKAASVPLDNTNSQNDSDPKRRFGIQVRLLNGSTVVEEKYVAANEACAEWQFISGSVWADGAYTKVEFALIYDYNANQAFFDGAQLFKERFAYTYTYDDNGRVETVTDLDGNVTTYTYRGSSSDITSITMPGGAVYSYSYNDSNLLTGTTSATGIQTTHAYDSYGNNTQTTITHNGNTDGVIQSNQTYTDDGNFLKTVTSGDRNTVTYNYNINNSTLTSMTDAKGTVTSNVYDTMRRLQSTTSGGATATYTYNKDRLNSITHSGGTNGTTYNFLYTTAGLTDKVSVGDAYTLVDNAYNSGTWTLASQTYGNGDAWYYTYNENDDLVSAYTTGDTVGIELKYFYNNEGKLARIEQYETSVSGTTITGRVSAMTENYYYDSSDRVVRIFRTDVFGNVYDRKWTYNSDNNVTRFVETGMGETTITDYTYDNDQRVSTVATYGVLGDGSGYNNVVVTNNYDGYGRIGSQVTTDGSDAVVTDTYTYRSPGDGFTSTQVENLAIAASGYSVTYTYGYDANGNITSIGDGTNTTTYEYDALNQLTRENNQAASKTWVWTYDNGGNITSRKEYNYTTGELGDPTDTINYTYGDTAWGDLLTAYNGVAISHDEIGNPTNDGTWNYYWNGRQLDAMAHDTATWSFHYNADGLRTARDDGNTFYEYVYNGSSLARMYVDENEMTFSYEGTTPSGIVYNGEIYYYVTNLQGDVIAILDTDGNAVVQYTYDAWGKILSTTGTLADTLGLHNPLRYRGYVYDTEYELYYLESRYYDPAIGRFLNTDAFATTGQGIIGNNMFAYCNNNPVVYSDPAGQSIVLAIVIGAAIGAVVGGVVGAVVSKKKTGEVKGKAVAAGAVAGTAVGGLAGWGVGAAVSAAGTATATTATVTGTITQAGHEIYQNWQSAEQGLRESVNSVADYTSRVFHMADNSIRVVDAYNAASNMIAESKYGYQAFSSFIQTEVARDAWLLKSGIVSEVQWHFYYSQASETIGGSYNLIHALLEAGIQVFYH